MAWLKPYLKDQRGAAAVEFALVGTLFIMTTLFVMLAGVIVYIDEAIDYATTATAREIMTGSAQGSSTTLSTFTQDLCNRLPAGLQCSNLIINLYVVTPGAQPNGYYTYVKSDMSGLVIPVLNPGSGQFTLGNRGDYQYLQVIYPITFLPSAFATMLSGGATFNGKPAYLAVATTAFRNEQF